MDVHPFNFESLLLAGIDEEWIQLHKWIRDCRSENKLSISSFLESCGLPSDMRYFRQVVSKELGITRRPSIRSESPGRIMRDTLKRVKCDPLQFVVVKSMRDSSFIHAISDWRMDSLITIRTLGFRDVSASDNALTILVLDEPSITKEELVKIIWSDPNISRSFDVKSISLETRKCWLQCSDISPVLGVNAVSSSATGTVINVQENSMLLTTAHLFPTTTACAPTRSVRKNQFDDSLTHKWSHHKDGPIFATVPPLLFDQDSDVAVGILVRPVHILGSTNIPSPTFQNWWGDSLPNFLIKLQEMTLVKNGASSGVTTGKYCNFSYNGDCFYVRGNEQTPFSLPGDSGSLVLDLGREMSWVLFRVFVSKKTIIMST